MPAYLAGPTQVILYTNYAFGDFQVDWFRQVTVLHSDLIKQVVHAYIRLVTLV